MLTVLKDFNVPNGFKYAGTTYRVGYEIQENIVMWNI